MKNKIAIVILNWNGYADTCECVDSALRIDYHDYNIILVDNDSDNNEAGKLALKYKDKAEVVRNNENLGYAEGNNSALNLIKKDDYDYIFILNNDTVVPKNILNELLAPFRDIKVGIVGATIVDYKNRNLIQNQGFMFSLWTGLNMPIGFNEKLGFKSSKVTNSVSGAGFMIRADLMHNYIFDKEYYCYGEDVDLNYRVIKMGFKVVISEGAYILHKGSVSSSKVTGFSEFQIIKNRFMIISKHANILQKISVVLVNFFLYQPFRVLALLRQGKKENIKYFIKGFYIGLFGLVTSKFPG